MYPIRVQKSPVVVKLLPHLRAVFKSQTTISEFLGIQEKTEKRFLKSIVLPTGESRLFPSEQARRKHPEERSAELSASAQPRLQGRIDASSQDVDELDLSYVPDRLPERFRRILKNYFSM